MKFTENIRIIIMIEESISWIESTIGGICVKHKRVISKNNNTLKNGSIINIYEIVLFLWNYIVHKNPFMATILRVYK